MRNFKKYVNINSFSHANKSDNFSTLLISDTFIELCKSNIFLKFLKKNHVTWIVLIGDDFSDAEDILDGVLEGASLVDENFINIVTTSFPYSEQEEIIYEFFISSTLGISEYQFISFLNLENPIENNIFEKIMKYI